MRVLFAGTPEVAVPSLNHLAASGHDIVGVVTQPDARSGRGRRLRACAVAELAVERGWPLYQPARLGDPETLGWIADRSPDVAAVVAYGRLLPESALAAVPAGWVNLHFSLLPRWRGAAPVQRAIAAGDAVTGATAFRIVPALDAGPILAREETPIGERETAGELLARLATDAASLLERAARAAVEGDPGRPQDEAGVTHAPKVTREDARLDFTGDATTLDRQIRAMAPNPGAWTTWRGERFKILSAHPTYAVLDPGQVMADRREVLVGTATRALALEMVQPSGKRAMSAPDWARGADLGSSEGFGDG